MPLTDSGIRSVKLRDKPFKLYDERGLYMVVTMAANYPEQLGERLRAQNSTGRSVNKAAFLAAKADVASALASGFVPKDIWRDLCSCQRVCFSYDTFLRLVKVHITAPPVAHTPPPEKRGFFSTPSRIETN